MKKTFTTAEIRDLYNRFFREEISFTRMVEILNERVSEAENPIRKFKKGDRVRIKEGVSSKTHGTEFPWFNEYMDELIGTTMTVNKYTNVEGHVVCNGSDWRFHEDWLEPYEELKKGDLAIFWDNEKKIAVIKSYDLSIGSEEDYFLHKDQNGFRWRNAIKFESKEQYERLINEDDEI